MCLWPVPVVSCLVVIATFASAVAQQAPAKKADQPAATAKDAPEPKAEPAVVPQDVSAPNEAQLKGMVDASEETKSNVDEVFKDPKTEAALVNTFKELRPPNPPLDLVGNPNDLSRIRGWAGGSGQADKAFLQRYVDYWTAELTSHRNIKALLDPPSQPKNASEASRNAAAARAIDRAATALIDPLTTAMATNPRNTAFLNAYVPILISTLPKLLDNHFYARIQAMIVLGMTGSPDALDIYIKQLDDPEQSVWVKLWAARGITNAAQGGRGTLTDTARAIKAGQSLASFLDRETGAPWPVRMRVVEAIGALRIPTPLVSGKAEMVNAAMKLLSDPKERIEVRSQAAWSLGMMKIAPPLQGYNTNLAAYAIGRAAADLGDQIVETHSSEGSQKAQQLTSMLLYQVYPALAGDPAVQGSGASKAQGADKAVVDQIVNQVKAVAAAAVRLSQAAGTTIEARKKDLSARVADLKATLDKNTPKDRRLVAGGAEYPDAAR
ncbi:hypothetical protein EP7_003311 [Isosphaeraceae bacterium EP7]